MADTQNITLSPGIVFEGWRYRRFFLTLAIALVVPVLLAFLSLLFLWRLHEFASYESIVDYQLSQNAIYGPGTNVDYFEYKLEMIRRVRPQTVVLGSSRALGFQAGYFNTSFVNAALGMRSLEEGRIFVDEMLRTHKPERIILEVDFWWFNTATSPSPVIYRKLNKREITTDKLLTPYRLISDGKLSGRQFLALSLFGYRKNGLTNYTNTGIMGLISSNGIRADGSMLYGEFALAGRSDLDPQFKSTLSLIKKGTGNYEYGTHIAPERYAMFDSILSRLRENRIEVYLIMPPVAPKVFDQMESEPAHYAYIRDLRAYLRHRGVPFFDFHNAKSIPASNCEFIDGYHSGDVTYLKMMMRMAQTNDLKPIIKIRKAEQTIAAFDGNIIDRSDQSLFPTIPEKDFMLLGCKRY
jgi:hypothetical protein